ncbi:hypothetical protein [Vibrio apostichopi]|uniref:hypothetical protein n=1 Tax=Vibrio apostichopi TaxID=3035453 RepID=UPI0025722BC4|nr:hypothetical protein [Vibrio sp. FE10]
MAIPTTAELLKIISHLDEDAEVNNKSIEALYNAYERGFDDANCGYDGGYHHNHAALVAAYQLGFQRSKGN